MAMHTPRQMIRSTEGAVAPTVALSLFGLIAIGGVAWDYSRMVTLDTELQNAADQAALAAATQLDGKLPVSGGDPGSMARARAAAVNLVSNYSRMANEPGGAPLIAITNPNTQILFFQNKAKTIAATDDKNAHYVEVTVDNRRGYYAMTPIVGAISRANNAIATAGLGSAVCNVPPVMMCNPDEPLNNNDVNFPFDANALKGVGMKLITGNATAAGNFGFLETGFGSGAQDLARALGYNSPPGDCSATDDVTTKPGLSAVVMDAINTRFDLSTNGMNTCPTGGTCSPSRNVRKDLVKGSNCGTSGGQGWQESPNPYRPTTAAALTSGYPDIMGHPRDMCHAISNSLSASITAGCTRGQGRIGNGQWDRDAYFLVNYGWSSSTWPTQTGLSSNATRYEVYNWELAHTVTADMAQGPFTSKTGFSYPVCRSPGITPGGTNVDRRRISAAVINCDALNLNGSDPNVQVLKWVDLFLVEPSYQRRRGSTVVTEMHDVYVEMIGETGTAGGATAGQVVRRDAPYLVD